MLCVHTYILKMKRKNYYYSMTRKGIIYTYTYTYTHTHIYIYIYICIYIYIYIYIHTDVSKSVEECLMLFRQSGLEQN